MSKTKPKNVTCQTTEELYTRFEVQAKVLGMSKNEFLERMIRMYVTQLEEESSTETAKADAKASIMSRYQDQPEYPPTDLPGQRDTFEDGRL